MSRAFGRRRAHERGIKQQNAVLVAEFPAIPECKLELASSYSNLALLLDTGRPKEAEEAHLEALRLTHKLALDTLLEGACLHALALTEGAAGDYDASGLHVGQALAIQEKLAPTPTVLKHLDHFGVVSRRLRSRAFDCNCISHRAGDDRSNTSAQWSNVTFTIRMHAIT